MFSTVFIDISLIFVQLGLEYFWKTVRDPPFYYLRESTCSMIQKFVFLLLEWSQQFVVEIYFVKICLIIGRIETKRRIDIICDDGVKTSYL